MLDQSFSGASGIKVRTIEAEASGGLVEIDLRKLKATAEGTYLLPSKELQAAGRWAFTLDVAQAKKEGKPVSPEDEKSADGTLLIIKELMDAVPAILGQIKDVKNARPHPIQLGIDKGLADEIAEMARGILQDKGNLRERMEEMVEQYLEANLLKPEGQEEESDGE